MKRTLSFVSIILLFVVLGCSLSGLRKKEEPPKAPPSTTTSETSRKPDDTTTTSTTSDSGNLTLDSFVNLKMGSSYEDTVKALGSEGNETSSSSSGKNERKTYKWESGRVRIYANFSNNEMTSKNQSGLDGDPIEVTKAQYDQIQNGMTIEEVRKIMGSDGALKSQAKFTSFSTESYSWKGPKFSRISVWMKDGKVNRKSQFGMKK